MPVILWSRILSSIGKDLEATSSFIRAFGFRAFLRRAVFATLIRPFRRYVRGSYSQDYEDLIIDGLLDHKKKGFYVDIGANDPVRSNNTMRFYKRGWEGITIEPNSACYRRIANRRPRDINLNIGISRESGKGTFHSFLPDTRSTFSGTQAKRLEEKGLRSAGSYEIELRPLAEVLDEYSRGREVDLMSIDTEGYDEQVLLSNNWKRFRPHIICIEARGDEAVHRILTDNGYTRVAATADNAIYDARIG